MTTPEQFKAMQRKERSECLQKILDSTAKRKLIVAGPGTGKTFTFGKLLDKKRSGNNLAMTFIKKLVEDMKAKLSDFAEVKTLHAYCKKILHAQEGECVLVPFLTKIIKSDANILGESLYDFDEKFRTLAENCEEITFYLNRGDYYGALGFDDSVYRLYNKFKKNPEIIPSFGQILIDEFQDFNPLEVAFIGELAKKGQILIVGDDDQAVYDDRDASSMHLRRIYKSPKFAKFELPFCSRCPEVIVKVTNCLIDASQKSGHLKGRIPKRFECYFDEKEADSIKYPKIILACCSTASTVSRYIQKEIELIPQDDIEESHNKDDEYPTVLVVGMKHYLREIASYLRKFYPYVFFTPSEPLTYGITDAYECLIRDQRSNLGWRILVELFTDASTLRKIIKASKDNTPIIELISGDFRTRHQIALSIIRKVQSQGKPSPADRTELRRILGAYTKKVLVHFTPVANNEPSKMDGTKPKILLTSCKGCKGLSAGHVFIVGVHSDSMPRDVADIEDVEISQFVVALTRTRKQCHVLSNKWFRSPKDKKGRWIEPYQESIFISWIPKQLINNRGMLKATNLK